MSYSVKDILKIEVAPALGCTEPVAIALGAAAAASLLSGKTIDFIEIWVDPEYLQKRPGRFDPRNKWPGRP